MLLPFKSIFAQITDTLNEVKVSDKRGDEKSSDLRVKDYSPGQHIISIDSIVLEQYRYQDMANLLSQQVPVFVKSYGLNNIATLNFRGASAAQSQVYWNGVPIQNTALGISDVSLLPVALMNKVNVVYGSSSALWGSGNVGGAVLLENDLPDFEEKSSIKQSISAVAASFGSYRAGLKTEVAGKKIVLSANLFAQSAQNNFHYLDEDDVPQKMNNAGLQSGVGLLQGSYKVNDNNTVTARLWYQQYYREVPPALFESVSVKNQRDESLRMLANWDTKLGRHTAYIKTAYIQDNLHYQDSAVKLDSRNQTSTTYFEAGVNYDINERHHFLLFTPMQMAWFNEVDTIVTNSQNRYALALAYSYNTGKGLDISINGRAEVVDKTSFLLPGLNASYRFNKHLLIRANVQRTYRVPTLNELYYQPGGNPNLKPERGWNQDLGYTITTGKYITRHYDFDYQSTLPVRVEHKRRLVATHSMSAYNRIINDWIIWFGGAIWTPHNVATVHSRGLQTENNVTYAATQSISLKLGLNFAYTVATTKASYQPNDGSIGKQIPYTPLYNSQLNCGFVWRKIHLNYNHVYTGLRYITTDESYGLSAYSIGNLQSTYTVQLVDNNVQITAQCNNIWNVDYKVVNARPMPGINWLLGASITIGH